MDAVGYSNSAKQAKRIKRFIENPDSNSGVLTQPKVIEAGETITINSGRQAVLADMVVDGDLVIEAGADVLMLASAIITLDYIVLKSATKNWKIKVDDLGNIITEEIN